eukprot:CAMPEP_0117460842 /NCGR_PEP_ID=MMETSP0784-20121206/2216_1 /TAXON_ID=39447 /ORGANISM="" /LENGTH=173 /DNA_ID=CAMNT_0005254527 /DNA_START=25 /DNA_END=542 /DNA_ORIENTATION=-
MLRGGDHAAMTFAFALVTSAAWATQVPMRLTVEPALAVGLRAEANATGPLVLLGAKPNASEATPTLQNISGNANAQRAEPLRGDSATGGSQAVANNADQSRTSRAELESLRTVARDGDGSWVLGEVLFVACFVACACCCYRLGSGSSSRHGDAKDEDEPTEQNLMQEGRPKSG